MQRALENLNRVAGRFLRGAEFVCVNRGQLKLYLPPTHFPAKRPFLTFTLKGQRNWMLHRAIPRVMGWGGTDEQTVCQLALWYRGQPRLPARVLKHWQQRTVGFAEDLDAIGYDDESSTNCILCNEPLTTLDWWSLGGVTGPSHQFGACRERPKETIAK